MGNSGFADRGNDGGMSASRGEPPRMGPNGPEAPDLGPQVVDMGNGILADVAMFTRKSGLNEGDVQFLVAYMRRMGWGDPEHWAAAKKRVCSSTTISAFALEAWKPRIKELTEIADQPIRFDGQKVVFGQITKTGLIQMPRARSEAEQCHYVFADVPADKARCVLRHHTIGGHSPGTPVFGGGNLPPVPQVSQTEVVEARPEKKGRAPGMPVPEVAQGKAGQCRAISDEDGERCVFVIHGDEPHAYVLPKVRKPRKAKAKRRGRKAGRTPEVDAAQETLDQTGE